MYKPRDQSFSHARFAKKARLLKFMNIKCLVREEKTYRHFIKKSDL